MPIIHVLCTLYLRGGVNKESRDHTQLPPCKVSFLSHWAILSLCVAVHFTTQNSSYYKSFPVSNSRYRPTTCHMAIVTTQNSSYHFLQVISWLLYCVYELPSSVEMFSLNVQFNYSNCDILIRSKIVSAHPDLNVISGGLE